MTKKSELTDQQMIAIDSLLSGKNRIEAAEAAGVDRVTIWRWFKDDPDFVAEYNQRRLSIHTANMERLRNLAGLAIDGLEAILTSSTNEAIVLKVAAIILKSVALADLPEPDPMTDPIEIQADITRRNLFKRML